MNVPLRIAADGDPGTIVHRVYRNDELVAEVVQTADADVEQTIDTLWAVVVPNESQLVSYDGFTGELIPGTTSSSPPV